MKLTLESGSVTIFTPTLDGAGKPRLLADGITPMGSSVTMTLEQYDKHARDPAFVAAIAPVDQAAIAAAALAAKS